jgi:hypothetical protein
MLAWGDDPPYDYQSFQQLSDTIATAPRICQGTVRGTTPAHLSQQLQCRFDVLVSFREYQIRREISGNQSSNRTPLTVSILVQVFDAGERCAWLDAGGTFDPESAAEQVYTSNNCSGLTASAPLFPGSTPPRHHQLPISGSFRG